MDRNESIGTRLNQIWAEMFRLIKAAPAGSAIYVLVLVGSATALDLVAYYNGEPWGESQLPTILSVALGYFLIVEMLRNGRLVEEPVNGFGTYFGVAILAGIGILLGFLLLVIPGIILLARWSPVYGFAMGDKVGVIAAFGQSWDRTRGHFWPILFAHLIPAAFLFVGFVAFLMIDTLPDMPDEILIVAGNLFAMSVGLPMTALGLAVYSLLGRKNNELTEVFS